MKLYTYPRSSAAWRIRIVLGLKNLPAEYADVHLLHGEQHDPAYARLNPQHLVPLLETGEGAPIPQSIAIAEYLEETSPLPPLLPATPAARAYVRGVMAAIACDIHPLNNLRVLRYLESALGQDQASREGWYRHWVETGLAAVEARVAASPHAGAFVCGDAPGLGDAFLVPQLGNARRYHCDLAPFPTLLGIDARCASLEAFRAAAPEA